MAEIRPALPEFANPPVVETVLGVQFAPLADFSAVHFGLYWQRIRDRYPTSEIQPPLREVTEQFDAGPRQAEPPFELVTVPEVRCWFIDESRTRLIQVQKDRYVLNWRKVVGDEVYPRYERLKPAFRDEWQQFCRFLADEKIEAPEVNQCEVTYINHVELGADVKSLGEAEKLIAYWSGRPPGDFLPSPERVTINARYVLPEKRGRLHVLLQPAIRRSDGKPIFQLTLTARGKPGSPTPEAVLDWFDLGHEWVVRGFADFTTRTMHKVWRRER